MKYTLLLLFGFFVLACNNPQAEKPKTYKTHAEFIADNYEKTEYQIPMRDGVKLFTAVYTPKDKSREYPILFYRTPYSLRPYGEGNFREQLGASELLDREMYVFVYQDVRGRFMSEGEFVNMRPFLADGESGIDESTDAYDSIDWLLKNVENHNGKVGIWGNSYPGFYAAAACIRAHPALKAATPQCPIADWYFDDFHHNGAFFTPHFVNFFQFFGVKRDSLTKEWPPALFTPDTDNGYDFFLKLGVLSKVDSLYQGKIDFWKQLVQHPNYDEFWQSRSILPHLRNIKPAVMTVGGWFDAEDLYGPFHIFQAMKKNKTKNSHLVVGPWKHGGYNRGNGSVLGNVFFGDTPPPSDYYQKNIELAFWNYHLKGQGEWNEKEAIMFETGTNRWRRFSEWPPKDIDYQQLNFKANQVLCFDSLEAGMAEYDEFISDPNNPVPFTEIVDMGMPKEYMLEDQRFAAARPDVLVYQTDILEENLTIGGSIKVNLEVTTTGTDADWIVKVIDVYPADFQGFGNGTDSVKAGGFQQMLRSEIFRARYRHSFSQPEPLVPNQITQISFDLQDVLHTFKAGHRIMVQVQSSWFPIADRNPQKYIENIYLAKKQDFTKATHRLYHSSKANSYLVLGIID